VGEGVGFFVLSSLELELDDDELELLELEADDDRSLPVQNSSMLSATCSI